MGFALRKKRLPDCVAESRKEKVDVAGIGSWIFFAAVMLSLIGFLFVVDTAFVFRGKFTDNAAWERYSKRRPYSSAAGYTR